MDEYSVLQISLKAVTTTGRSNIESSTSRIWLAYYENRDAASVTSNRLANQEHQKVQWCSNSIPPRSVYTRTLSTTCAFCSYEGPHVRGDAAVAICSCGCMDSPRCVALRRTRGPRQIFAKCCWADYEIFKINDAMKA
jgi:hypothetical protein